MKTIDDPTILFYCEADWDKKSVMVRGNPANIEALKDSMIKEGKETGTPVEIVCGLEKTVEEFSMNLFGQFLLDKTVQAMTDMIEDSAMRCDDPKCHVHGYDPSKVN